MCQERRQAATRKANTTAATPQAENALNAPVTHKPVVSVAPVKAGKA
jgi:cytochrome c oxidase assembly protein Cox11